MQKSPIHAAKFFFYLIIYAIESHHLVHCVVLGDPEVVARLQHGVGFGQGVQVPPGDGVLPLQPPQLRLQLASRFWFHSPGMATLIRDVGSPGIGPDRAREIEQGTREQ